MDNEEKFDDLVGLLYEAAVNPDLWRPTLARFSEMVGAQSFHMFTWDKKAQKPLLGMVSHDHLAERIRLYDAYYHQVDPVLERALRAPAGQFFASQEFFDDRFIGRSEYYQDFLISNNQCWAAGGVAKVGNNIDTVLALVRNHDFGRFSDDDLARARRFWQHFGRATALFVQTEQLRQQADLGSRGLEQVEIGVVATDGGGLVLFMNAQAEAMIMASGRLKVRGSYLSATDAVLDGELRAAIGNAAKSSSCRSLAVPTGPGMQEDLFLTVAPLRESAPVWTVLARASVLVLVRSRTRQRMLSVDQLMQLFRLTPAEARLARALAHGQTPEAYALDAGIALATVRTQLRAALAKTGTRRQTELVRLLVSVPPSRG